MRMRWKSLLVVGAVVVIGNALVMAQPIKGAPDMGVGPKGPGYPQGLISVLAWWLDLTKEQVGQMQAIVEQARPDAKEAAAAVAEAQETLHEAVTDGAGEKKIRAAAIALGKAIGNQAVLHAETLASLKAVLTDEQLKDFYKIQAKLPQLAQLLDHLKFPKGDGEKPVKQPAGDKSVPKPIDKGDPGDKAPAGGEAAALATAFKTADTNKDGVLSLAEFLAALANTKDGAPPAKEGDKTPAGGDQPVEK